MCQAVPTSICLLLRKLWAQHNIAQHRRASGLTIRARSMKPRGELINRETHHIRRAGQIHPMHVQLSNGVFINTRDRGFHIRANIHGCQCESRDIQQHFFVDAVEARLIEKFDTHMPILCGFLVRFLLR